jgi:hypothetical protein
MSSLAIFPSDLPLPWSWIQEHQNKKTRHDVLKDAGGRRLHAIDDGSPIVVFLCFYTLKFNLDLEPKSVPNKNINFFGGPCLRDGWDMVGWNIYEHNMV